MYNQKEFKTQLFKILDSVLQNTNKEKILISDAYLDNKIVGYFGTFIDAMIYNGCACINSDLIKQTKEKEYEKIIIFCELLNNNNKINIYKQKCSLKKFSPFCKDILCDAIFINIPFNQEHKIISCDMTDYMLEYLNSRYN